ncbi:hypothetical protein KKG22_05065 [Patescibacteria group bacterium]|nr:hypothetical protein [Patescibacteria group bacterium]
MNFKTRIFLITSLVMAFTVTAMAQSTSQNVSLEIRSGAISIFHTPDNFLFDPTFINTASSTEIYKTLDPAIYENQLVVEDADTTGDDFYITIAISNLASSSSVIPFSNLALVTLAQDASGLDIFTPSTPPADQVDVTAPLYCPSYGDLATYCDNDMDANFLTESTQLYTNDPMQSVNTTTTNIYVDSYFDADPNVNAWKVYYSINEIIEFSDGEKALVTGTTPGPVGSAYITVIRGVLNTTPSAHTIGSGITSHGNTSVQEVIMNGPEPVDPRIGAYSMGFGFKGLIEPVFLPGDYTGTITFTLYIS